jgi:hypothetical protein
VERARREQPLVHWLLAEHLGPDGAVVRAVLSRAAAADLSSSESLPMGAAGARIGL